MDWLTTALFVPIPSEFFKLNAAHYGSQHNNRFRISYVELTLIK
ncbi:hypothetical protein LEP1GSC170_3127 [Leptospira interrogans serovar Bataviae str. HAI135]|nr:hypothetical protein LEP1GSC170_3127 [Leptospira interrogans serovar Bataviae str. HAI135]